MQDYIDFAAKNGITLADSGNCQFCGANTNRGIHECLEIFNLGFQDIDYSDPQNHLYRFLIVDAHTLQHPEIHGRWSNHFHLSRLHLVFKYNMSWKYELSPKLSDYLNRYKINKQEEYLTPPPLLERGNITTTDILQNANSEQDTKEAIKEWALEVYARWDAHYEVVDFIAKGFMSV